MSTDYIMEVVEHTLGMAALLAGPMLGVGLVVGLIIAVFQAATHIQESALTFVPKMIAIGTIVLLFGPWGLDQLVSFTRALFEEMANLGPGAT